MSARRSVLIIRPCTAAQQTAAQVAARGFTPFIVPLSAIVPLPAVFPDQYYDAVLATSANAFLQKLPPKAARLRTVPLYCVGRHTALAARKQGFSVFAAIAKNVEALCTAIPVQKKAHFLYLAGKQRRPVLEKHVRQAGITLDVVEVYETQLLEPSPQQQQALPDRVDTILLYSTAGILTLASLARVIAADTKILCLSPRIAAAIPAGFPGIIKVAAQPTETALLSLLAS